MKLSDAVSKSLTGRRANTVTNKAVLETAKQGYGATWKDLAAQAGISDRTMRRLRKGGKPSPSTRAKLDTLSRQPEVRQAAMRPRSRGRMARARTQGANVKIRADQGPAGGTSDYTRLRIVECELPSSVMNNIYDAYADGNDESAAELLKDAIAEYGFASWTPPGGWEIGSVDSLTIH